MPFQQNGCVITHSGDAIDGEVFAVELDDKSVVYCCAQWCGRLWSPMIARGQGPWPEQIDQRVLERGGVAGQPIKVTCLLQGSRFSVETSTGKIMFDKHIVGLVKAELAAA